MRRSNYLVSVALGAVLVTAFAPFYMWPLAFLTVAGLFALCWRASPAQAFNLGFVFGLGLYLSGVSWVYVSLSTYGGMPLWMGMIAVFGFSALLASFIGLACYVACRFTHSESMSRLIALVPSWTVFEWGKSWVLTGFPWLDLGYTQTPSWMFSFAPIGGVYFISFCIALCSVSIVALCLSDKRIHSFCLLVLMVGASFASNQFDWSSASGKSLKVGIAQGNVDINEKWQIQYRDNVISKLVSLTSKMHSQSSPNGLDLVVWPETALPLYYQQTDQQFWQDISPPDTALITGLMDSPNRRDSYNAAVLSCDGAQQIYHKRHLVPFGEYLPLRFLFNWVLEYLQLPMSDMLAGEGSGHLECGNGLKIGLSICYEDSFAAEMRNYSGEATILVNISEDAWFGDSLAPHQRLQIAQMRARELSRPLVRSANTGPSVIIDHLGQVVASTKQFQEAILTGKVEPQQGDTPFKKYGNWIIPLCFLIFGMIILVSTRRTSALN